MFGLIWVVMFTIVHLANHFLAEVSAIALESCLQEYLPGSEAGERRSAILSYLRFLVTTRIPDGYRCCPALLAIPGR
jgi:transposase-like protein